ncbi:Rpp20 subunit of nuclear RNase MRP and P-domain-containing protein [Lophiotrema nucula]|uniref:Rpp20 subunit of nuclear RNase MRP and P-domain-containing protein n=1 Tax=Lophiotrema nucula TaxID=690887 RepID=A0A6A5YTV6_9PLEO|nr:Rpp20 subunit of nuclear RNase MRP and P-domain-containing protein [Lophiotrema nucula]
MASEESRGDQGPTRKRKRNESQESEPTAAAENSHPEHETTSREALQSLPKKQKRSAEDESQSSPPALLQEADTPKPPTPRPSKKQKLPKLPKNATITKRPLHRPAIPHPYTSSFSPKTLYIKTSTPFIPTIKRIRSLLLKISDRSHQSAQALAKNNRRELKADGRLDAKDVEREIADRKQGLGRGGGGGEKVYLKATGRAISRALEIGVFFQGEVDCNVKVKLGSVRAIDDIEVRDVPEEEAEDGDGEAMDVDVPDDEQREVVEGRRGVMEIIPETRIRTLSSVTVAVGLK